MPGFQPSPPLQFPPTLPPPPPVPFNWDSPDLLVSIASPFPPPSPSPPAPTDGSPASQTGLSAAGTPSEAPSLGGQAVPPPAPAFVRPVVAFLASVSFGQNTPVDHVVASLVRAVQDAAAPSQVLVSVEVASPARRRSLLQSGRLLGAVPGECKPAASVPRLSRWGGLGSVTL